MGERDLPLYLPRSDRAGGQSGVETTSAYMGHRFDQFTMLIEATVAGLGLALLPRYLVEQELRDRKLEVVIDLPLPTENNYYFVLPLRDQANSVANLLFEWISTQVGTTA